jgi:hypothetical protein
MRPLPSRNVVHEVIMKSHKFRAGDRVIVRSPEEILSTLDADGTLHGLPFMPEMLDWCGKSFRIERWAEKTCVDVASPVYPNRRFAANDVVFLDGPRCGGQDHDGCKRGCKIFWKKDWLRPFDSVDTSTQTSGTGLNELLPRLKTKSDENHYFCQSTQLYKATEAFPGKKKLWMLRIVFREIRNGDCSVSEVLKLLVLWSWQKLLRVVHGKQWLRGPHKRTPTVSLGLKPGDIVHVKSRAEMVVTLDHERGNKGLKICYEMTRYCGGQAEVRERVDRMIDERTGKMREIHNTVSLQNMRSKIRTLGELKCLCFDELGDCPRGELMYWREIWLERENGGSGT